jgi:calcium/calmodulin-dependent protein kinase (CaM kinase) II
MTPSSEAELIDVSRRLLKAIDAGDWNAYAALCDDTLTCFEPEAGGHLVSGMPFHKYYFDLPPGKTPRQSSISSPHVRIIGDAAIVSYVRLVQKLDASGTPVTACVSETRVWHRDGDGWKHVHFHRS